MNKGTTDQKGGEAMKRRSILKGFGVLFAGSMIFGGASAWFLRAPGRKEALVTDPDMRDFIYSDGWIIPLEK